MEIFIPWEVVSPFIPFNVPAEYVPHVYGIFFTTIATFYVMLGGMLSIVWTDVVQFPDYDSGRYRNCCYRNANGSAGHDSFFRSYRLGLSFLRMDAGYRLEQPDEPLDGTDGE